MNMNMRKQLYAFGTTNIKIKPILLYENKNQIQMLMNKHENYFNLENQTRRFKQPKKTTRRKIFINSQQMQIKNNEAQGNEFQRNNLMGNTLQLKQSKYQKIFNNQIKDGSQNCKKESKYLKLFGDELLYRDIVPKDNSNQSEINHFNRLSYKQHPQQKMYYTHFSNNRNRKEKNMLTIYKQRTEIGKNKHDQRNSNSISSRITFNKIKNTLCRHQFEDQQWQQFSRISKQQKQKQMMVKKGKNKLISLDYIEQEEDFESDQFFRERRKGGERIVTYYQNLKGIE